MAAAANKHRLLIINQSLFRRDKFYRAIKQSMNFCTFIKRWLSAAQTTNTATSPMPQPKRLCNQIIIRANEKRK